MRFFAYFLTFGGTMCPKCIIIKSLSKEFHDSFLYKLKEFHNIRFFHAKINGLYTVVIKCHTYYQKDSKYTDQKIYGNYIFLYSMVSIILVELLLTYYEQGVSKRIICSHAKNIKNIHKLSCLSALLLDENSPFEFSKNLYQRRSRCLLDAILLHFRKKNFIYTDHFIDFSAPVYLAEMEKIIAISNEILENKSLYNSIMGFIFQ